MRNKFPGPCYRCGAWVPAGEGHFERFNRSWRVQHAACAIEMRGTSDPAREAVRQHEMERRAAGTGSGVNVAAMYASSIDSTSNPSANAARISSCPTAVS